MAGFLDQYELCNIDTTLGIKGYVNLNGEWVLVKETAQSRLFVFGSKNYQTHFSNRENLTYETPDIAINNPIK